MINNNTAGSTVSNVEATSSVQFIDNLILQENIHDKIRRYATKYDVSYEQLDRLIACETSNTYDPTIQSRVKYNFSDPGRGIVFGQREKSYGLVQIHIPDHPDITIEQAKDPDFALTFLLQYWSKRKVWWSCWALVN